MNGLSIALLTTLSAMKGQFILRSLKGVNSAYLDLLRLASAAAAWRSWVDLLTGTPNTALWVTSLRMRLWPLLGAILGEEGGVREPTLCNPLPGVCQWGGKRNRGENVRNHEFQFFFSFHNIRNRKIKSPNKRVKDPPGNQAEKQDGF